MLWKASVIVTDESPQIQNTRVNALEKSMPSQADIETLAEKCKQFNSFKANVLRSSAMDAVEWNKKDDKWTGGVQAPKTKFGSAVKAVEQ